MTRVRRAASLGCMNTVMQTRALSAHDRCDRCGAQAYVKFSLIAGGELLFCAHHARAHEASLEKVATKVIDETASLAE